MKIRLKDIVFIISLLCAIWFALTGWMWPYWIALYIAYPFGLLSFILWLVLKNEKQSRRKIISTILLIGLGISLLVLISYK